MVLLDFRHVNKKKSTIDENKNAPGQHNANRVGFRHKRDI